MSRFTDLFAPAPKAEPAPKAAPVPKAAPKAAAPAPVVESKEEVDE